MEVKRSCTYSDLIWSFYGFYVMFCPRTVMDESLYKPTIATAFRTHITIPPCQDSRRIIAYGTCLGLLQLNFPVEWRKCHHADSTENTDISIILTMKGYRQIE